MKTKITRRAIAALEPEPGKQVWLYDTELPGFLVLCQPSGRRSYLVRYRTPGGATRKLTLGLCAELHPDDAREMARVALATARRGEDPGRDRTAPTVADLARKFTEQHAARLRPGTRVNYEALWRRHILPRIGTLRVIDVKRADVARLHDALHERPHTANRALEVVSKAFDLAEIWGLREEGTNPCRHVRAFREEARQRTLDEAEVGRLWSALDRLEVETDVPAAAAIRLLLLTGCRKNEILRARWDWIDWDRGLLRLPDHAAKTGARDVFLSDAALDVLRSLPRWSVYILPGRTGGPIEGLQKIWERVRASIGMRDVRLHDLRHTVGSLSDRAGLSQRQIADLLGHKQLSTTARYINSADVHKRATADAWGAAVVKITGRGASRRSR